MNFRTADDMSAILAVKLTKRLGFGMRTKLHLKGLHVEGKVRNTMLYFQSLLNLNINNQGEKL